MRNASGKKENEARKRQKKKRCTSEKDKGMRNEMCAKLTGYKKKPM